VPVCIGNMISEFQTFLICVLVRESVSMVEKGACDSFSPLAVVMDVLALVFGFDKACQLFYC